MFPEIVTRKWQTKQFVTFVQKRYLKNDIQWNNFGIAYNVHKHSPFTWTL